MATAQRPPSSPWRRLAVVALALLATAAAAAAAIDWSGVDAVVHGFSGYQSMVVLVGNSSGVLHVVSKNGGDPDKVISIASASKWVSAALIMRVVERTAGSARPLTLQSRVVDWLPAWAGVPGGDVRATITLAHLMSQTDGLRSHPCAEMESAGGYTADACVTLIADAVNPAVSGGTLPFQPGSSFFYSGLHMETAAAMALRALNYTGPRGWTQLVDEELRAPLGLPRTVAYLPATNPLPAAFLYISPRQYGTWLTAYMAGDVVSPASRAAMQTNYVHDDAVLHFSPMPAWRYGLGQWLECRMDSSSTVGGSGGGCTTPATSGCDSLPSATWQPVCANACEISSIGHLGFYPYMDRCFGVGTDVTEGYWGIIAVEDGDAVTSGYFGSFLWPAVRAAFLGRT